MSVGAIISNCFCPKCEKRLTIELLSHDIHGYCLNCYEFCGTIRNEENCCFSPEPRIVKKYIKDRRVQLKKQCCNCHSIGSDALSQSGIDLNLTPEVDLVLEKDFMRKRESEFNRFKISFQKQFSDREGVNNLLLESGFSYENYKAYLFSDEWRAKRFKVLERDEHTCQACLNAEANQVHHITYKHLMNEPLFELVSVCEACHQKITRMDKAEYNSVTQEKLYQNLLS